MNNEETAGQPLGPASKWNSAMKNKFTFTARKLLTLTVFGDDEFDAEEKAYERVGDTPLDEWAGADEDDELELYDTEEIEEDEADDQVGCE